MLEWLLTPFTCVLGADFAAYRGPVSVHSLSSFPSIFQPPPPKSISTGNSHLPAVFRVLQPLPEVRSRGKEEGRGCLYQESLIPLHPTLTPPTSPSGWLPCSPPLQAPETPSTQRAGRGQVPLRGVPPGMQLAGLLEEASRRRLGRRTQRAASQASPEMKLLCATMRELLF